MADFGITSSGPSTMFLEGELDMATVPLMEPVLSSAIAQGGPVTIDVSELTFVDSSGIGAIMRGLKDLRTGCIILHGAHGGIQKVLDIMGVDLAENLHVIPCAVRAQTAGQMA
jgi:anti-anti-sigma factor